jgi:15-cis-phytoene synthase
MSEGAFDSFVAKLLARHPEFAIGRLFVPPAARRAVIAFECLAHELVTAALDTTADEAATAKLQWWSEEIERGARGAGRHPVTTHLFADGRTTLDPSLAVALLRGAIAQRDSDGYADADRQFDARAALFAPLVCIERAVLGTAGFDDDAALRTRVVARLVDELAGSGVVRDDAPLAMPMSLLARHQLDRAALATPSSARTAAIHEQLAALDERLPTRAGDDANVLRRMRVRTVRATIRRAGRSADPLAALQAGPARPTLMTLWHTWREVRRAPSAG